MDEKIINIERQQSQIKRQLSQMRVRREYKRLDRNFHSLEKKKQALEQEKQALARSLSYEATLVITVFGVFFTLMFSRLSADFLPSKIKTPVPVEVGLSVLALGSFTFFSFLIVFDHLHLLKLGKLEVTKGCSYFWHFVKYGVRILAIAGAPLGLFYVETFFLYSILPEEAFVSGSNYGWGSFLYFIIWAVIYWGELCKGIERSRQLDWGLVLAGVLLFLLWFIGLWGK